MGSPSFKVLGPKSSAIWLSTYRTYIPMARDIGSHSFEAKTSQSANFLLHNDKLSIDSIQLILVYVRSLSAGIFSDRNLYPSIAIPLG